MRCSATRARRIYVAGCRFKDAFAGYLRQVRAVPALTIDWGYWGEVGGRSDAALRERRRSRASCHQHSAEGVDAFERALCAGVAQVMPVAGRRRPLRASACYRCLRRRAARERRGRASGKSPGEPTTEATEEAALAALERLAAREVAAALAELCSASGQARRVMPPAWAVECGIAPAWQRFSPPASTSWSGPSWPGGTVMPGRRFRCRWPTPPLGRRCWRLPRRCRRMHAAGQCAGGAAGSAQGSWQWARSTDAGRIRRAGGGSV